MAPVTPEQAAAALANRRVPPSDVPAQRRPLTMDRMAQAPSGRAVAPVLGHDLPTDAKTEDGFPRADFAIAPASRPASQPAPGAAALDPATP